jgi:hypothetical protein
VQACRQIRDRKADHHGHECGDIFECVHRRPPRSHSRLRAYRRQSAES